MAGKNPACVRHGCQSRSTTSTGWYPAPLDTGKRRIIRALHAPLSCSPLYLAEAIIYTAASFISASKGDGNRLIRPRRLSRPHLRRQATGICRTHVDVAGYISRLGILLRRSKDFAQSRRSIRQSNLPAWFCLRICLVATWNVPSPEQCVEL